MRFGITSLEGESIKKIFDVNKGINSISDLHFSDIILDVIHNGFRHCEITLDLFQVLPIKIDEEEQKRIKSFIKDYDITYSAHFPIWSVELSSPNKFIREGSIQTYIDSFKQFRFLEPDIEVFIVHPTGAFTAGFSNLGLDPKATKFVLELLKNYAITSIKKILRLTKVQASKIAIENIEFPFDKTIEMIKTLKTTLCIDTAHALGGFSGNIDLIEVTKSYLDIASEIHLQDYSDNVSPPDHAALGKGKNFPIEFLNLIHDYGFEGPVVFELGINQALESMEYIKEKTPQLLESDV
jgi:sugar phosphate isomerase/epimerase